MVAVFTEGLIGRYDHQERLTAMEAMEHAYFFPVIKVRSPCASLLHSNMCARTTRGYPP